MNRKVLETQTPKCIFGLKNYNKMKELEEFTWDEQARNLLEEGEGYLKTLEKYLHKPSRFDDELLFNMTVLCFEKLLVALQAHYEEMPQNHVPLALFKDAQTLDGGLTPEMEKTMKRIQSHESICSFENKGYKVPDSNELKEIISGLVVIKDYVSKRINE